MDEALRLQNVSFGYNRTPVLEDITFSVDEGEFLGLVGPNGSGKTTLLKLMLGILETKTGSIEIFGESSARFSDGNRIGYVPQESSRKGDTMPVTVREVVTMGRFPDVQFGWLNQTDHDKIKKAMEQVEIESLANKRISHLSSGQRQRAFIARALTAGADLLLLDEPTAGVDAESKETFYSLLEELNDAGITVILIEHDLECVANCADRIVCLNRTIRYDGPAEGFLEDNSHLQIQQIPVGRSRARMQNLQ